MAAPFPVQVPLVSEDTMELDRTERPVVDTAPVYNAALVETRAAILRWRTRSPPSVEKVVEKFREAQIKKIGNLLGSSLEVAEAEAEDPSPYDKEHLFYCLTPPKESYSSSRRG